ncbi:Thiol-disulfide isomerase or thioredoxin [Dyadobacter soli]|uniref:Thiol-disulfide isomerase or thioredoxin n=1 Tax=Dyadobacter soli TaxID=659014 RepID=A0A1G7GGV6_9BACT|nr:TlpA disulfide reductase family protein [Dyadobacter soli]SDE87249.1 Thiol-disulfide isomerase or thioredoxin [Dyadobacter soli]
MKNLYRTPLRRYAFAMCATLLSCLNAFGQGVSPSVNFSKNPAPGDTLKVAIQFPDPAQLPLGLYCIAYINDTSDYPIAKEIVLNTTANGAEASVPTYNSTRSVLCVLLDSTGKLYNNEGKGYWTPMWKAGEAVEGALASIAEMYAGAWSPENSYHLGSEPKLAHDLYNREFAAYPGLKRKFFRHYLGTFDLNDAAQRKAFREELDVYAGLPDLDEWELSLAVNKYYAALGETELAARYKAEAARRYPKGSLALQNGSLPLLKAIYLASSFDERMRIFQDYKERFTKEYPDEFTERVLTNRKSQMLGKILQTYPGNDIPEFWLAEVNTMNEEFSRYAYKNAGRMLLEEGTNFALAEKFAKEAADRQKRFLNAPRVPIERSFKTDRRTLEVRKTIYGEYLALYGRALMLQKKYREALPILEEASVRWCKRGNAEINQHYIESLIHSDMQQRAISEMDTVIAMGKSTERIQEWHKQLSKDKKKFATLKASSLADIQARYKDRLINEKVPEAFLTDLTGNKINLDDFQGKTIVLDCWASWCAPCIAGFPAVKKLITETPADSNIVYLFINMLDKRGKDRVNDLFEQPFRPYLLFDDSNQGATALNVSSLPTKIIIDRNFRIRFKEAGITGGTQEQADQLLAIIGLINRE